MADLEKTVAIVTGASRGVGRGVALGLGESGATVYLTGRTRDDLEATAEAVSQLGGRASAIVCDHTNDAQVASLFERVARDHSHLDLLVNSVWGGYEAMSEGGEFTWTRPFWEQPLWRWDAMFRSGVRAAYAASAHAARSMVAARSGLIVNISALAVESYTGNVAYGTSKAATDKMTSDMATELRPHGVAAVSLSPGLVRTESVLAAGVFDLSGSESPQFIGRVVAALASDSRVLDQSGKAVRTAELALHYGVRDLDGSRPA